VSNVGRFAVFIVIGSTLISGWHYFLWARLVRDPELPAPYRTAAAVGLVAMAIIMPLSMVLGRSLAPAPAKVLSYFVFSWMGLAFLLFFALLAGDLVKLALWAFSQLGERGAPADPARRLQLARLLAGGAAVLGVGAAGGGLVAALGPILERVRVPLRRLPASMSGLRLVQISDVHLGTIIGREYLERVVAQINALEPDLVAITGDLVDGSVERLRAHAAPLAGIRSKHGVFFVTGNHEYYSGAPEWVEHLATLGVRVLRNERVSIGEGEESFDLAGVDDWSSRGLAPGHGHDLPKALGGRDPSREVVLLAHQPRSVVEAAKHGVGLVLSGHTHGGQIFPWRFFVYLQQRIVDGLHQVEQTHIYVSRGTGFWGPPMRVGARGEVTEITLVRAPESG
jgi:uncharacterized protein